MINQQVKWALQDPMQVAFGLMAALLVAIAVCAFLTGGIASGFGILFLVLAGLFALMALDSEAAL